MVEEIEAEEIEYVDNPRFRGMTGLPTGTVLSDEGKAGEKEVSSYNERSRLPTSGTGTQSYQYWDASRGVNVSAPIGSHFLLYPGGGVKVVSGLIGHNKAPAQTSSLFTQPTEGVPGTGETRAVPGFTEDKLAYQPVEGKEIVETGLSVKNPTTGVDEYAGEGEVLISYTDGTVERRKVGEAPGAATPVGEFGRTAEELGITRRTEIKGGPGGEVTRAPQSAAQVLQQMIAQGAEPEAIDELLQSEGQSSTADLQLVGKTYRGQTAKEGYTYYVDPKTKEILQRPEALSKIAQPLTIAGVAGTKLDVVDKFRSVFGREPNAEELKYWLTRTDKVGVELVAAMQFAKQQGGAMAKAGAAIADPVEAMKAAANVGQSKMAQFFTEQGITPRSDDRKALRAQIEALEAPETKSQLEFTKEQLASSQFQEATNALQKAKDALRTLDADYLSNIEAAERTKGLSMGAIRRNLGELDIAYNRTRRDLVAEVEAKAQIVSSQTQLLGLMIDAFKTDQQTAQQDYVNRFNKASTLYNMLAQEEQFGLQQQQFAFDIQKDYRDTQRANLSVLTGLISEGRIDYDNLSTEDKAGIARMEQAAGLTGITRAIAKTPIPPVVSMGSNIVGADGTVVTPIYSQDPVTGEVNISHFTHPIKERVPEGSGSGSGDILSGLLSGVLGQGTSDWVIDSSPTSAATNLEPPPMSGIPGTKMEYNGYIWTADKMGNWI